MKKGLKKLAVVLVAGFALVGVGGTVAFASGGLIFNIQENFDEAKANLGVIGDMFDLQNKSITDLKAEKGVLEDSIVLLQGDRTSLESTNTKLKADLASAVATRDAHKAKIDTATRLLATFNGTIEDTSGTKHKLESALVLIENLSTELGTEVDLTELKSTIEDAQQDNTDLTEADKLMEAVAKETQAVIDAQELKAPQE